MAGADQIIVAETVPVAPGDLVLDKNNPRIVDVEFKNEDEVVSYLLSEYDVDELVVSILTAGWLDYEPLLAEEGSNVVFEGNRRLAALKLIGDSDLRDRVSYRLPKIDVIHPNSQPQAISVRFAKARSDANVYIGFKHINGPFKWDALAKAKFASEWVASGQDVEIVSRTLGDSHLTVLRLINGWNVLQRAIEEGFDPGQVTTTPPLPISHLYTALTRPDFRTFLGIEKTAREVIAPSDIPPSKTGALLQAMSWLFGQKNRSEPGIIRTQNPDLSNLVRVIAHRAAFEELVANRDLGSAVEILTPGQDRFEIALRQAARSCSNALALADSYDGSPDLLQVVASMGKTVLTLRDAMQGRQGDPLAGLADDTIKP
jgi:hypothetical protein